MKKQRTSALSFAALLVFSYGCGGGSGKILDTPTTGTIHITVDESYQPMMEAEIDMFQSLYVKAKINATYASEGQAFKDLLADSSRLIVVNRELNEQEKAHFAELKITPKTVHIANDGLAFIVNNENPMRKLLYGNINAIFTGKIKTWKELQPTLAPDSLRVIFDHAEGGNVRMIRNGLT